MHVKAAIFEGQCSSRFPNLGRRVSELLSMRVSQVDISQGVIRLETGTTKNRDGREVMMREALSQMLTALVHGKAADDRVFTRGNGKPVSDFRQTWRKACTHAGVPEILFHDLRRTAARNLRRAGVAEGVIMKIGGCALGASLSDCIVMNSRAEGVVRVCCCLFPIAQL